MKALCRSLHYRTKLSMVLIGMVLIPALVIACLYYIFVVRYNHERLFGEYRSWLVDSAVRIQEKTDSVLLDLRRFQTDTLLLDYLKHPERYSMTQKIDIFAVNRELLSSIASKTDASMARSVRVYGCHITHDTAIPGPMYSFQKLEAEQPEIARELRATQADTLYRIAPTKNPGYNGSGLTVYQLSRDIYGEMIAVNEIVFSFSYFSGALAVPPAAQGFLFYAADGAAPIPLYTGSRALESCFEVYREYAANGGKDRVQDYFVLSSELMYRSGSPADGAARNDRLLFFFPQKVIYQSETEFLLNTLSFSLVAIALVIITIRAVSQTLTKRLYQLLNDISVDTETLISGKNELIVRESDEFGQIKAKFQEIIEQVQDYSRKALQSEYEKEILEAELMQDLIAPHFLYNTLDGMRWSTDDPNLIRVIDHMVNFYRIALNKGNFFVTITQEFEMVRSYLEVQRFSYESEFRYALEMDESLRDVRILKHIIQPIVENALVHGIDKREDRGFIRVSAHEKEGVLQIEITDNGAGMTEETIAQLLDGTSQIGYGVHNVIQRIALFYGGAYGLKIQSRLNEGSVVWVTLPLRSPESPKEN